MKMKKKKVRCHYFDEPLYYLESGGMVQTRYECVIEMPAHATKVEMQKIAKKRKVVIN